MKTVLVKLDNNGDNMGFGEVLKLRKWCYANVKTPWSTFVLDQTDDTQIQHAAFQFESQNEAMKFQLYKKS